jgi:hypothetical protein
MTFYVQYDPTTGLIQSTVQSNGKAPNCDNQLVFGSYVDITNKVVDLNSLTLVDAPVVLE